MRVKLPRIKFVLTDIDGVWTDGGMYYGESGEVLKKFNTRDGMGVARLRKVGIETIIVTSEDTEIVKVRARKLGIGNLYLGIKDKAAFLEKFCKNNNVDGNEIAYIGDDFNDLGIIGMVGFTACPKDAIDEVRSNVHYVCKNMGGCGAFREFAELIIKEIDNEEFH